MKSFMRIPYYTPYLVDEVFRHIEVSEDIIGLTEYYGDFLRCIYKRYIKESWRN